MVRSQVLRYPVSARYISNGSYSPQFASPFRSAVNPACLSLQSGFCASLYAEEKYMVRGLGLVALAGAVGNGSGGFGAHFQYFGNPSYHEITAGAGYGKWLGKMGVGATFGYRLYTVQGLESDSHLDWGLAVLYRLTPSVHTGLTVMNPRLFSAAVSETTPFVCRLDIGYEISPQVCFGMEWKKEEGRSPEVMPELQYRFTEKWNARIGLASAGSEWYVGMGWEWETLRVEIACVYHTVLGLTPGVLFLYRQPDNPTE